MTLTRWPVAVKADRMQILDQTQGLVPDQMTQGTCVYCKGCLGVVQNCRHFHERLLGGRGSWAAVRFFKCRLWGIAILRTQNQHFKSTLGREGGGRS